MRGVKLEPRDGELNFSIDDDGPGFNLAATTSDRGSGLVNMRDRIGSVDGVLTVSSSRGQGTTVCGVVPYPLVPDQQ